MATVQFRTSYEQVEAEVEAQIAADLNITWETPSTPAHSDDYVIINGIPSPACVFMFLALGVLLLDDNLSWNCYTCKLDS